MAAIGQAEANAAHVRDFLALANPPSGARLLIAGAGPGQMFDYADPAIFLPYRAVFSDINPRFLARLRERCPQAICVVDDIERSALAGPFHAVMETLVLEHVNWRKAVATLSALEPVYIYLVVQQNPPEMTTAVTPSRTPTGSMSIFARTHPRLLDIPELSAALNGAGYRIVSEHPRPVADGKTMLGLLARSI